MCVFALLQTVVEKLKKTSAADLGTYIANANTIKNLYAKRDVLGNYNEVKNFFSLHLDAYITTATLEYFGVDSMDQDFVPEGIKGAAPVVKASWLGTKVEDMVNQFIMVEQPAMETKEQVSPQPSSQNLQSLACPVCAKPYKYRACLRKHIKQHHGDQETTGTQSDVTGSMGAKTSVDVSLAAVDDTEDHCYNYGCVTLMYGLLLRDIDDAVSEGDGSRILRLYKFLLLLYKMGKNKNYALAVLKLLCSVNSLLSQKKAHQVIWNRTINEKKGKGRRKSLDLKMENLQLVSKTVLRRSGMQNLTADLAIKTGKFIGPLDALIKDFNSDLGMKKKPSHSSSKNHDEDLKVLVDSVRKAGLFKREDNGRKLDGDATFSRDPFCSINVSALVKWMNDCKTDCHAELGSRCVCHD